MFYDWLILLDARSQDFDVGRFSNLISNPASFPPSIMDIKTLLNNLHEEVSCSVCMTTFTDPKQLPCLHSFCLHCLNGILRTSGRHDIITCPECRKESRVPSSGNLKDLRPMFESTVCLMCWLSKSVTLQVSNVETVTREAPTVSTASSVARSGVTTVLPRTTYFELIKNTECWRLKTSKIKTSRAC